MKLADFTADEIEDKNMQRKVLHRLPGKGKRKLKAMAMAGGDRASIISAVVVNRGKNTDASPRSNASLSRPNLLSTQMKAKIGRLTSPAQKQDQRASHGNEKI